MSLSNLAADTSKWGTIFMGPGRMHETSLSRLETARSGPVWNEATEAEYFERVKAKATAKAREILESAQAAAAAMLEQAHQEGYQQGLAAAQAELDEFREAAGQTAAAVLSAIESQVGALTSAWEDELCNLVRFAVETGIGHELKGHRAEILEALFREAVSSLAVEQKAVVYAHPEDEPVISDIIASAGEDYARRFQVRGNPQLAPGSVVLENSLGMVENTMQARRVMLDDILKELNLRDRVAPEKFVSAAGLHEQMEEVTQPEQEFAQALEADLFPEEERIGAAGSELAGGESPDGLLVDSFPEKAPDVNIPADEAGAASENAAFHPEEEAAGAREQAEDAGSLIPQELLNGQSGENAEVSGEEAPSFETLPEGLEAGEEAGSAQGETGQAEASQAAADMILENMHDKGGE